MTTTNTITFQLRNLQRKAQSHVLFIDAPRGPIELLFSYGELIGIFDGKVCNHLTGLRKTSMMHVREWADGRAIADRGIGDLQVWLKVYFNIPSLPHADQDTAGA